MPHVIPVVAAAVCVLCFGVSPANAAAADSDDAVAQPMPSGSVETETSGSSLSLLRLGTKALAMIVVPPYHFRTFDNIVTRESSWDVFAINPSSGAYGIGQALPPEKMASHGADWRFNPLTQIRWTYDYMNERYGSPDNAWEFWQEHHWY
jgi:hypothetical protein